MRIGDGAFASVYRVRQNALDRWVAVKVLDEKDPARKRGIISEATTQARIKSDCIPQVYHVFEWKGRVWIVMEWIRGVSLSTILARMPSPHERMWLADGCIRSLACLHGLGFAHRDLKPANIIISPDKGAVLVDFGFAKHVVDGQESMAGVVKGTPAYMAPELWMGKRGVDPMRGDVFALGKILRDVLAEMPFDGLWSLCASEYAEKRPADGRAVLELWNGSAPGSPASREQWRGLSREQASHHLSEKLVEAARILLGRGRQDEAYWLLVESIEENPANADAVGLMNSFPKYVQAKKRQRRMAYAGSIAFCACLFFAAFVIGWNSRELNSRMWRGSVAADASRQRDAKDRSALIAGGLDRQPPSVAAVTSVPLREDCAQGSMLLGSVFVASHPLKGSLIVDGEPVATGTTDNPVGVPAGVSLPHGMHTIAWVDNNGKTLWREKVNLLPFETKIVSMAAAAPEKRAQ
jgi:predicted Ser/Thr protein kinase